MIKYFLKKCQRRTVTANTEPKISCFSSTGTRGPHITILIRCGVMAVMWHVGSAICPSLAIHIITTCCSDSWILSVKRSRGGGGGGEGHLSLFRHCLFNHGRPINFSRPCPLQGQSLPAARVSHCLDPFTSVVNE